MVCFGQGSGRSLCNLLKTFTVSQHDPLKGLGCHGAVHSGLGGRSSYSDFTHGVFVVGASKCKLLEVWGSHSAVRLRSSERAAASLCGLFKGLRVMAWSAPRGGVPLKHAEGFGLFW